MKIMYVGCNPVGAKDLLMDSEVTELSRLLRRPGGEPVDFAAYPRLPIEYLPLEVAREQPDILHIAAHGGSDIPVSAGAAQDARNDTIALANADGAPVTLNGDALAIHLKTENPPTLVYLNGW